MDYELIQPWGPLLLKSKLPEEILEYLLKLTDDIIADKEKVDFSSALAGQIKNQFFIKNLSRESAVYFTNLMVQYILFCHHKTEVGTISKENLMKERKNSSLTTKLTAIWVVSQFDNEYNPIHTHHNCSMSGVCYLKIPNYLPPRQIKSFENSNDGNIIFDGGSHESPYRFFKSNVSFQPEVGDIFMFPSSMKHLVYPFRTMSGKEERRSISFNGQFQENKLDENSD